MRKTISVEELLSEASILVTTDDSNPEYDRAVTELVGNLLGLPVEAHAATLAFIRSHSA